VLDDRSGNTNEERACREAHTSSWRRSIGIVVFILLPHVVLINLEDGERFAIGQQTLTGGGIGDGDEDV
jgi:hypothetical protein